jgi:ATP-dependent DNA helicase RecQ
MADFCNRFKLEPHRTLHAIKFLERDEYIAMTETVFLPSRVQVLFESADLYKFQVEQPTYDPLIKVLLRSYGGVFDQLTGIKESDLAKRLGMNRAEVVKILQKLQVLEVIHYVEQTDKPHMVFVKPRVDSSHLIINKKYHADRYQIHKTQIQSIVNYAVDYVCRSRQLLLYFNEPNAPLCGVCDVCLDAKKKAKNSSDFEHITKIIFQVLGDRSLVLNDLMKNITVGTDHEKLAVIRTLLDAGTIKINKNMYSL